MAKRITYLISDIDRSIAFEWIVDTIDSRKFELSFILFNKGDSFIERFLLSRNIKVKRIPYTSKKQLLSAVLGVRAFLKQNNTEVVHAHLFDAGFIGMLAAKIAGVKQRIYTRHYAALNHVYFPNAVKWDRFINRWSTHIIAVSEVVKKILVEKENVDATKVTVIHHGFKLNEFAKDDEKKLAQLKNKYNAQEKSPVIGVISRFIELKGVQFIVPAFKNILKVHPNALLLLFNAKGDHEDVILSKLKELPQGSYQTIAFEENIVTLYHLFDIFIHVPIAADIEAFGQTYIESLASGIPLIATPAGIAPEFLIHEKNALLVPFNNSDAIEKAMLRYLSDKELQKRIVDNGFASVKEKFELERMIGRLESLYLR